MTVTKRDIHYMNVVMASAISSEKVVARVSAMIVIKNKPISLCTNQRKTHPFQATYGKNKDAIFLHAEVSAIKNALNQVSPDDLKKATLYVARAKKANNHPRSKDIQGMAKPCTGCLRCISDFDIKRVVHTTSVQDEYGVFVRS